MAKERKPRAWIAARASSDPMPHQLRLQFLPASSAQNAWSGDAPPDRLGIGRIILVALDARSARPALASLAPHSR